jgi:chromosome segregation ATPase
MTGRGFLVHSTTKATLALLAILIAPASATAQASAAGPVLDQLLGEVRLLRQAIEQQGARQARAQLLIGRLSLQDQRVARLRAESWRLESETGSLGAERTRMQAVVAEMGASLERASSAEQAGNIESELRMLGTRLQQVESTLAGLESQQVQARQALEAAAARYDELERWFDDLERDLSRSAVR